MPIDATPRAVLHIGDTQTTLTIHNGTDPACTLTLAVGIARITRAYFRHNPPSSLEMETAIAVVEDAVMPALRQLPAGLALHSCDTTVHRIARLAGVPDGPHMVLSIEAMEACFDRLAAVVQGRPSTQDVLPPDNQFAATLLILRELMHHLGFDSISWEPAPGHPH